MIACPECDSYDVYQSRDDVTSDGYTEFCCYDCGHYFVEQVDQDDEVVNDALE